MHSRGFTLIEMVVVLAILATITLLVIPRLPDSGDAALKRSARGLASTIRYLKDQAAVTQMPHRLHFYPGEGKIDITIRPPGGEEKPSDDPFLRRPVLADGIRVSDIQIPRLGKVSSGELMIDLGPAGMAEITTIHLREPGGKEMTVTAYPYGGKVKVDTGYREVSL